MTLLDGKLATFDEFEQKRTAAGIAGDRRNV
jgi:hypothetical protein